MSAASYATAAGPLSERALKQRLGRSLRRGSTVEHVARFYRVPLAAVKAMARRIEARRNARPFGSGHVWSEADTERGVAMREAGASWRMIAEALGRTEIAARTKLWRLCACCDDEGEEDTPALARLRNDAADAVFAAAMAKAGLRFEDVGTGFTTKTPRHKDGHQGAAPLVSLCLGGESGISRQRVSSARA